MSKCKCGTLTLGKVTGPAGTDFQMGCPLCKDTVTVKA